MAASAGNKAKGRQHSHDMAARKVAREKRDRRKTQRKLDRARRIAAAQKLNKSYKPSPSDLRRTAARKHGFRSDLKRVMRYTPKA
jgi:hypothetical protein